MDLNSQNRCQTNACKYAEAARSVSKKDYKMKLSLSLPLFLIALLVASGCSSVTTLHPLSSNTEPIDQEKFEGVWLVDDGTIHVKFASNGVARIAGLEWKDGQFHVNQGEAIVTQGKQHNFLSVRYKESDGRWEGYYFLSYKFTDQGDLILWPPVPEVFAKMVKRKELQGIVKKGKYTTSVSVTNAPGGLFDIINNPENLELFDYREPLVLKKIAAGD